MTLFWNSDWILNLSLSKYTLYGQWKKYNATDLGSMYIKWKWVLKFFDLIKKNIESFEKVWKKIKHFEDDTDYCCDTAADEEMGRKKILTIFQKN